MTYRKFWAYFVLFGALVVLLVDLACSLADGSTTLSHFLATYLGGDVRTFLAGAFFGGLVNHILGGEVKR